MHRGALTGVVLAFALGIAPPTPVQAQAQGAFDSVRASGGWVLATPSYLAGGSARLSGRYSVRGTQAILQLDSATSATPDEARRWVIADSVTVQLALDETVVSACGTSPDDLTGFQVAIVRDSAGPNGIFPVPRLAWTLDTLTVRIRPVAPSSVVCVREYAAD